MLFRSGREDEVLTEGPILYVSEGDAEREGVLNGWMKETEGRVDDVGDCIEEGVLVVGGVPEVPILG